VSNSAPREHAAAGSPTLNLRKRCACETTVCISLSEERPRGQRILSESGYVRLDRNSLFQDSQVTEISGAAIASSYILRWRVEVEVLL